jgi:integrase
MQCNARKLSGIVSCIRAGKPPKLQGKTEATYILTNALGTFGTFGIRQWPTGASWFLQTKRNGKPTKDKIGDVQVLDLDQALNAAKEMSAKMQLGLLDPVEAKKNAMRAAKVTFETVVPLFLKSPGKDGDRKRGTLASMTRYLTDRRYFGPLHKLPIDEITSQQLNILIDKIEYGGDGRKPSQSSAWQCYWILNGFFEWANRTDKVPLGFVNPMGRVRQPKQVDARTRVLDHDEIRLVWNTCLEWESHVLADQAGLKASGKRRDAGKPSLADFPRIIRLMLLTGCRPQEIGDMQWSWLDLDAGELAIPRENYKTDKKWPKDATHIIFPLCSTAVDILRSVEHRRPDYVFGSPGNKGRKATGVGAGCDLTCMQRKLNKRLQTLGAPAIAHDVEIRVREMLAGGVPNYRIRREAHVRWSTIKQIEANVKAGIPVPEPMERTAIPDWQMRDLRRTFRTHIGSIPGVSSDIAERMIGHLVGSKMQRVYDKYEFWAEKRAASNAWEAHLHSIIDGSVAKIERPKFGRRSA